MLHERKKQLKGVISMNELQIFNHSNFGHVEIILVDGKEYFSATQSAKSLGYVNPHKAIIDHCNPKGLTKREVLTNGGIQEMNFMNEGNLYRLITKSKLPDAEKFESWVFDEVLPTIRKTGSYQMDQFKLPQTMVEAVESYLVELKRSAALEDEKKILLQQNTYQEQKLKEQEAPVAIYNLAISAHNSMSMQEVAKSLGTGRTRLFNILREEQIVMKGSTMPYQRFLDAGYFKVTERPRASGDTVINDPATRVTAKGFDYIARLIQKRAERHGQAAELLERR